jgi:hypothetical protein
MLLDVPAFLRPLTSGCCVGTPARLPGRRPKTQGIGLQEVGVKLGQNGAIEVRTGPCRSWAGRRLAGS